MGFLAKEQTWGEKLFKAKKYEEAETVFVKAVRNRETVFGKDNEDTLSSKYWLVKALYHQGKYQQAEEICYLVVQGRERTLGMDHEDTLASICWLGQILYDQGKYQEAEKMYYLVVQGRETTLEKDHKDTLTVKCWLGHTLHHQGKHQEGVEMLSQAVEGFERTLGKTDKDTLTSKSWLGMMFHHQGKNQEAEEAYYQVVQEQERTLGKDHKDTLTVKCWLGHSLHYQEKYQEGARIFQEVVNARERILGKDHEDTLYADRWLTLEKTSIEEQQRQKAGNPADKTVHGQEKTTAMAQEAQSSAGSQPLGHDTIAASKDRLNEFFLAPTGSRQLYNDSEIAQISTLLRHVNPAWSRLPRTYIILRTIDCLDQFDEIITLKFSDYYLPVNSGSVPSCLSPKMRSLFLDSQKLILTQSINLEKGAVGHHCHFEKGELIPFHRIGVLGSGGYGQVDKILSHISFKEYARKRVQRRLAFGTRGSELLHAMVREIEAMKKLKHHHIVEFVGSYTDPKYLSVIMHPVAEQDLSAYLKTAGSANYAEMRTFFGCLATGLRFLHDNQIRHKDIKPGNILVDKGRIYLTDFGLSLDFTDAPGSTTSGTVNGMTARYCAPEVAQSEARNTSSDIWSLGVIFLEMIVVLKGRAIEWMDEFLRTHGSHHHFVRLNLTGLQELLAKLKQTASLSDNVALAWIQHILQEPHKSRPTAASLVTSITQPSEHGRLETTFCGLCCLPGSDDTDSDSSDDPEGEEFLRDFASRARMQ